MAVKLGDNKTRNLYVLLMILPFILIVSLFIYNIFNPGTRIGATIQIQLLAFLLAWLGIFIIVPVILLLGLAVIVLYTESGPLVPALKSTWLLIHI